MTTTLEGNRAGETYNAKRDKVGRREGKVRMKSGDCEYLKYVRHDKITEHLNSGWQMANDLQYTHHGNYSVIMVWTGKGVPK